MIQKTFQALIYRLIDEAHKKKKKAGGAKITKKEQVNAQTISSTYL